MHDLGIHAVSMTEWVHGAKTAINTWRQLAQIVHAVVTFVPGTVQGSTEVLQCHSANQHNTPQHMLVSGIFDYIRI